MRASDVFRLAGVGFRFLARRVLGKTPNPLVGGIAVNDRCNLHCLHCSVSNRGIPDMSMREIQEGLRQLRALGIRVLYIEGGEPFLWRDHDFGLEDLVGQARAMGFGPIIVYTNGTLALSTAADAVFVSLDGLRETNDRLRGPVYDRVLGNIAASDHPNIIVNFTVSTANSPEIEPFLRKMAENDHVRGVSFYFYTPTGVGDELGLAPDEKRSAVDRILAAKAAGLPVRNSRAALRCFRSGNWRRPSDLCYLYADNSMYRCCRSVGSQETCEQCGYLGYVELYCMARLQPGAVLEAVTALRAAATGRAAS